MPWATAIDNVYLPLRLAGMSRAQVEPDLLEALSLVGLTGFENAYPRELSGGMKMRVSIARAHGDQTQIAADGRTFCRPG